jgi:hypothetical protein
MTKKEEKQFDEIHNNILVECSIDCQKCGNTDNAYTIDGYDYAEILIKAGWVYKNERILCPTCATPKRKQK